jgi:hypothetical protein
MNIKKFNVKSLFAKGDRGLETVRRFSFVLFISFVALLYGFVLLRINSLSNAQPSNNSVTSQVQAAQVPHIEESVVKHLESLHNNSVNVQTLFNEARSNPFQ